MRFTFEGGEGVQQFLYVNQHGTIVSVREHESAARYADIRISRDDDPILSVSGQIGNAEVRTSELVKLVKLRDAMKAMNPVPASAA